MRIWINFRGKYKNVDNRVRMRYFTVSFYIGELEHSKSLSFQGARTWHLFPDVNGIVSITMQLLFNIHTVKNYRTIEK